MALGPTGRRRAALVTAAATALLSLGGVLGSTMVKSPAQAVADSAPPKPSVITTPVARQKLVRTLVFRGDFGTGKQTLIAPTAVAATGADGAQGEGGARGSLVVTKVLVSQGDRAQAGRPLAEVSGRPVFVLPGALPGYRDLLPGLTGEDVEQLQTALAGLGIGRGGDRSGYFGPGTKAAVGVLYRRMGYEPPVTGARTEEVVKQTRTAWEEASETVAQLERGTSSGTRPAPTGGSADGSGATAGSGTDSEAESGQEADSAGGVERARKRLQEAKKAYDLAVAANGVMLPASEAVFVKDLPARVSGLPAVVGDRLDGPVVVLTSGGPRLTGYLDPALDGRLVPGTKVQVTSETLGLTVSGKVASIGERVTPGDGKDSGAQAKGAGQSQGQGQSQGAAAAVNGNAPYLPVTITPDKAWDDRLEGHNVMITVTSPLTGAPVLVVPQAALLTGADTHTTVTVQDAGGRERKVRVVAGASADGLVQVTPADGAALREGDLVVVGR